MKTAHPRSFQFDLALEGPIDFDASLSIFRRSGDDLLDRWDGARLIRTTSDNGRTVPYACEVIDTVEAPVLRVTVREESDHLAAERAVSSGFLPILADFTRLCRNDPLIGHLAKRHRGFRPVLQTDLLTALVRCISAQQVNLKWASTVRSRLAERFGTRHEVGEHFVYHFESARLASLQIAEIRALQFTTRKAEYVINAARAIADGALDIVSMAKMPDDEVIARITAVRGLGLWTAEWVLARTLGRPRVSAGDLGVRKAVGIAYLGGKMPTPDEVRDATAHWGSAAAMAQGLLLHAQHEKTLHAYAASRGRLAEPARSSTASVIARGRRLQEARRRPAS